MGKKKNKKQNEPHFGSLEDMLVAAFRQHMTEQVDPPKTGYIDQVFESQQERNALWMSTHISDARWHGELRQGVAVIVPDRAKIATQVRDKDKLDTISNSILVIAACEPNHEYTLAVLDTDTAKKLTNALGTAIAMVEERVEAKG